MSASISRTAVARSPDFTTLAGIADSHASTSTRFSEPTSRSNAARSSATARNSSTRLPPASGQIAVKSLMAWYSRYCEICAGCPSTVR